MTKYEGNVDELTIAEIGELELSLEDWTTLLEDESGNYGKKRIGVTSFAEQEINRLSSPDPETAPVAGDGKDQTTEPPEEPDSGPEQEVEVVEIKVTKEERMGVEADVFGRIPGGPSTPANKPRKSSNP